MGDALSDHLAEQLALYISRCEQRQETLHRVKKRRILTEEESGQILRTERLLTLAIKLLEEMSDSTAYSVSDLSHIHKRLLVISDDYKTSLTCEHIALANIRTKRALTQNELNYLNLVSTELTRSRTLPVNIIDLNKASRLTLVKS